MNQLAGCIASAFRVAPTIAVAPVLAAVITGAAVTYTAASGVAGTPTPTVHHDLWKNGVLLISDYVSGAYLAESAGDVLQIVAWATNGVSPDATASSSAITVTLAGLPIWVNQTPGAAQVMIDWTYPFLASNGPITYALVSGTLPPGATLSSSSGRISGRLTAPGTYTFVLSATNTMGTVNSSSISIVVSYAARLMEAPIEGIPLHYEIPGFSGTINGQQWYQFVSGTGWVAIAGATGSTLSTTGLVGSHISVRVDTSAGAVKSYEFPALGTVVSQTALLTGSDQLSFAAIKNQGITVYTPCVVRAYCTVVSPTRYIDTEVAPGTYTAAQLGDFSSITSDFYVNLTIQKNYAPPPVAAAQTKGAATATRPVSTSTAFFVSGRCIYDPNGVKFNMRGANYVHYDNLATGMYKSGANAIRYGCYLDVSWSSQKSVIDKMISVKAMPILGKFFNSCSGMKGTVTGNTLTLTARTTGRLYPGLPFNMTGLASGTTIVSVGTVDANGLGTYTISNSAEISTAVAVTFNQEITGKSDPEVIKAAAQNWIDASANILPYVNVNASLNIANEWGPAGSATNTVWRDAYGYKDSGGTVHAGVVQTLRAAGFTGLLIIDAPGSGQDNYAFLNHAASVLAADPLQNILFDIHIYGAYRPGQYEQVLAALRATGLPFIVGEFAPGTPTAPDSKDVIDPGELMASCENHDFGWLYWSWDDKRVSSGLETDNSLVAVYDYVNGYSTQNPADLTIYGKKVVLNPVYGTQYATPATIY